MRHFTLLGVALTPKYQNKVLKIQLKHSSLLNHIMLVESDFVEPLKCKIHFITSSEVHFSIEANLQNDFLPDFFARIY